MPLERLHLNNFRLFKDNLFEFGDGANLILGKTELERLQFLKRLTSYLVEIHSVPKKPRPVSTQTVAF